MVSYSNCLTSSVLASFRRRQSYRYSSFCRATCTASISNCRSCSPSSAKPQLWTPALSSSAGNSWISKYTTHSHVWGSWLPSGVWTYLSPICLIRYRNEQECQKIFKARDGIDSSVITQKLIGYGVGTIEGIDPNPDNFVSAAIIHTRLQQIGCLLRLEPNRQAEVELD